MSVRPPERRGRVARHRPWGPGLALLASATPGSAGSEPAATIRIGVEAGEVVVGEPTDPRAVAGAALDVARRLCDIAAPGTVLAGERAWSASRSFFRFSAA